MKKALLTIAFLGTVAIYAQTGPDAKALIADAKINLESDPESYQAGDKLKKAIKLDPNNPEAYYLYAKLCQEKGNIREARINIDKAIGFGPENNDYLWLRSRTGMMSNSSLEFLEAAAADLRHMIKNGVNTSKVYNALAIAENEIAGNLYHFKRAKKDDGFSDDNSKYLKEQRGIYDDAISHYIAAKEAYQKSAAVNPAESENAGYRSKDIDKMIVEVQKMASELK